MELDPCEYLAQALGLDETLAVSLAENVNAQDLVSPTGQPVEVAVLARLKEELRGPADLGLYEYLTNVLGLDELRAVEVLCHAPLENAFASAASRRWYFANLGKKNGPKQGPVSANNFPADAAGNWEAVDKATGEVLVTKDATEIRAIIEESAKAGESLDDLEFRPSTPETRAAEEKRREDAIAAHEARAAQIRAAELNPNLPGGKYWVDPPEKLYHATYAADEIAVSGFKTAEQLGPSSDVLGGSRRDSVSFTTKANAEKYRDGLELARRAAQGEIDPADFNALKRIGQQFGVSPSEMRKIADANSNIHDPRKRLFSILQGVSFAGRQFPLFMGGNWTDTVAKAKPAKLVEIDSKGPENWSYQPGEAEWRIGDPQRITGVRVVDSPTDNAFASDKQRKWYFANLAADKGASGGSGGAKPNPRVFRTNADVEKTKGWPGDPVRWQWKDNPGRLVTGAVLDRADLPDSLYHVTTAAGAVRSSGMLRGANVDAGLGGGQEDGVSFTTSKSDADLIQRELTRAVKIAKGDITIDDFAKLAREDERIAGLPEGSLERTVSGSRPNYDVNIDNPYTADVPDIKKKVTADAYNMYLQIRSTEIAKHGPEAEELLKNPILFGNHDALKKVDPKQIQTLEVPKAAIPQEALITSGSDDFLHEARVYSDVPLVPIENAFDPRDYLTAVLGLDETRAEQLLQNAFATATQRKWYFANLGKKGGPKAKGTVNKAAAAIKLADEQPLGGGVNTTFTAAAPPPINGLAVYKPASGEKSIHAAAFPEGTLHQREIAASVLGDELGLANIPKTVLAEGSQGVGSAQAWSVGHLPISDRGRRLSSNMDWEEAEKITVFDLVAGSSDRHPKNWLVRDDRTIVAIDNGFSFPDNAHLRAPQGQNQLRMRTSPSLMVRMPAQLSDATVARLESLKSRRAEVSAKLAPHLSEGEISSMWERLDVVLANKDNFRNYFADDLKIAGLSFFNSKAFQ